jgi:hypothetical protein
MLGQPVGICAADMNFLPWVKSRLRVGVNARSEQDSYISISRLHLSRAKTRRCLL